MKLYPGVWTPLRDKGPADIDFVVVRENTEDLYVGVGGSMRKGTAYEVATQTAIYATPVRRVEATPLDGGASGGLATRSAPQPAPTWTPPTPIYQATFFAPTVTPPPAIPPPPPSTPTPPTTPPP